MNGCLSEDGSCLACLGRQRKYRVYPAVGHHSTFGPPIPVVPADGANGKELVRSNTLGVIVVDKEQTDGPVQISSLPAKDLLAVPKVDHQNNISRSWSGHRRERAIATEKRVASQSPSPSPRRLSIILPRSPLRRRKTAWDLECDKNGRTEEDDGKRMSNASDKPLLWAHGLSTSPSSKENSCQPEREGSFKRKYKLPQFTHRTSIREKSNSGHNVEHRRKALRQRSMSLDAAEELWACALAEPESSNKSPSRTSPNLSEKDTKSQRSIENASKRSNRMSGSSFRSRKSNLGPDGETVIRHKKKRSTTNLIELFHAVERQNTDRVQEILEDCSTLDINSTNSDEFTPLDVAVLLNHIPLVQLLLSYGARENARHQKSSDLLGKKLQGLHSKAKSKVIELKSIVSAAQLKDNEPLLRNWEFREKLFGRMLTVFENADCPSEPENVQLTVASSSSLLVTFSEPLLNNGGVVTRYKVEWSCFETFLLLVGEQIMDDPQYKQYEILDLVQANSYYVRVSAANFKGFGKPSASSPAFAVPSNWKELDDFKPRWDGKLRLLEDLFTNIKNSRPPDAPVLEGEQTAIAASSLHLPGRKSTVKKSIKNLFSSSPKFQKTLKRGVYLAALICSEDRILVTNEDLIPIIEVDETFLATALHTDYHWLMKIACTWKDVKSLRQDLEKSSSPGVMQFRCRLLQAIGNLQLAIGLQDLGQFYHRPVKDANGSIILTAVNYLNSTKAVNTSQHVKWVSLGKMQRRSAGAIDAETLAIDVLLDLTNELVKYHRANSTVLAKGLYLGYLKLQSSVELIHIMVPQQTPNVLPSIKIRDCPNVTREEWEWIRSLNLNNVQFPPTAAQLAFQNSLTDACRKLLQNLGIGEDEAVSHRLYDLEVIEFSADVSFILVLPHAHNVCAVPGHTEETNPGCIVLPVQVFEMVHMRTYQFDFISRYSRLSSILEIDLHLAQQAFRQAFSSDELAAARQRLDQLGQFQQKLDEAWKAMRWTMDIITYARDKSLHGGLPLGVLFALPPTPDCSPSLLRRQMDTATTLSTDSSGFSDFSYHSDMTENQSASGSSSSVHKLCPNKPMATTSAGGNLRSPIPAGGEMKDARKEAQPGILRVYSTCSTGFGRGTSVKLHVTPRTTAREVVSLVVQQMRKASFSLLTNHDDCCLEDNADNFCLVLVVGTREHVLRDDFQPLQLQNPWTRGRLYVQVKRNFNTSSTVSKLQSKNT